MKLGSTEALWETSEVFFFLTLRARFLLVAWLNLKTSWQNDYHPNA